MYRLTYRYGGIYSSHVTTHGPFTLESLRAWLEDEGNLFPPEIELLLATGKITISVYGPALAHYTVTEVES